MAAVLRVGMDSAGGIIAGPPLAPTVFVNGAPIVVVGTLIAPHGPGPHAAASMAMGSSSVFAGGLPVCRDGDAASCGDSGSGGSPDVNAG